MKLLKDIIQVTISIIILLIIILLSPLFLLFLFIDKDENTEDSYKKYW